MPLQPTTIKIPPELKARVVSLAAAAGKSVHAFLLEAIEQQADRSERHQQFVGEALEALEQVKKDGAGYPAKAVHKWLRDRAAGKTPPLPRKVAWRR